MTNFHVVLREEYRLRCERNPRYSLRAFSRDLKINSSILSRVLRGERMLSAPNIRKAIASLKWTGDTYLNHALPEKEFALIGRWYHYALLSLARIARTPASPASLGKRLGLEPHVAARALQQLLELGLLEIRGNFIVRTSLPLSTSSDVPSSVLRRAHREDLALAARSLDRVPVEKREISSITVAANSSQLKKAKEEIRQFRRRLAAILEQGEPDAVYNLCVQLYPYTLE